MYKKIVNNYIKGVQDGSVIVCQWVKLAIDRHLKDLERDDLYFDEEAANRFLKFSALCKYTKGDLASQGKYIEFTPQQVFRYWVLMGWMKDGVRRFRKVYFEVARKNGKSEEAAVLCAYMLLMDKEYGAEIYSGATSYKQAQIVFKGAKEIISKLAKDSPKIKELATIGKYNVAVLETNSSLEPISANDEKQDGANPHLSVIDEYHAHPDAGLLEVMQTGMGSRKQPMLFIITTAGFEKQYPCYAEERKVATEILLGVKTDDSLFSVIYTLDEGDDWKDKNVWVKSNPNIGITPTWEFMEQQCQQAINQGVGKEVEFKTKNLNIWTDSSMTWISDENWMLCDRELPNLEGRTAYAGLDLASTKDTNAYVLIFPPESEGEPIWVLPFFWLPKETINNKSEIGNYPQWVADGYFTEAGEFSTDHDKMYLDIVDIHAKYNVVAFAYDRYLTHQSKILENLFNEGFEGFEFGQGMKSMSPPTKDLDRLVANKKIAHGGNPVLRWMCGNIEITIDPADQIKIDKKKSRQKVDGMVSLVMAIGCWRAFKGEETSVYESRGIREI